MNRPLNKDKTYLIDIIKCCKSCIEFTKGLTPESFSNDRKTLYAVQHQIMVIGETSKRISNEFKAQHADEQEIWKTIKGIMPKLLEKIQKISQSI